MPVSAVCDPSMERWLTLGLPAYETSLAEGLHVERRLFHQLFATVSSCLVLPEHLLILALAGGSKDWDDRLRREEEGQIHPQVGSQAADDPMDLPMKLVL